MGQELKLKLDQESSNHTVNELISRLHKLYVVQFAD